MEPSIDEEAHTLEYVHSYRVAVILQAFMGESIDSSFPLFQALVAAPLKQSFVLFSGNLRLLAIHSTLGLFLHISYFMDS